MRFHGSLNKIGFLHAEQMSDVPKVMSTQARLSPNVFSKKTGGSCDTTVTESSSSSHTSSSICSSENIKINTEKKNTVVALSPEWKK